MIDKEHTHCFRCHRKLKNPIYRERGFGKVCWEKYQAEKLIVQPLFEREKDAEDNTPV